MDTITRNPKPVERRIVELQREIAELASSIVGHSRQITGAWDAVGSLAHIAELLSEAHDVAVLSE